MILDEPPTDSLPILPVALCFIEYKGHVLFLLNSGRALPIGKWSIPTSEIKEGEPPEQAIRLKVRERCQLELQCPIFIQKVYSQYSTYWIEYHLFREIMTTKPTIKIDDQSQCYAWYSRDIVNALNKYNYHNYLAFSLDLTYCIERIYGPEKLNNPQNPSEILFLYNSSASKKRNKTETEAEVSNIGFCSSCSLM